LCANIRKELQLKNQVALSDVIAKYPLSKGLAELITYIAIASADHLTIFDESCTEVLRWVDEAGLEKQASVHRIIMNRGM
jgi:hypothetical protein